MTDFCWEHNEEDYKSSNTENAASQDWTLKQFAQIESDIFDEVTTLNIDDLKSKYDKVWDKFILYLNTNFNEFVCLSYLGSVLKNVRSQAEESINRKKPNHLEYNLPNLIVCPQDEIIKRTLSMYALKSDQSQPLPTFDEVLYCTERTTCEEIDLFWRRCLLDQSSKHEQKIYCLMNVQDLLQDQAVKAYNLYEKYSSIREKSELNDTRRFLLCVLSSVEKEHRSKFVDAFNKHLRNVPLEQNIETSLVSYLSQHFQASRMVRFEHS